MYSKGHDDWESKCHTYVQEGQLCLDPQEGDGENNPGNASKYIKNRKVIGSSQDRFVKEKSSNPYILL